MKALVLHSGGLDSSTLLAAMKADSGYREVISLGFYYGSKHNAMESNAARELARALGVRRYEIRLDELFRNFKSALLDPKTPIPKGHYQDESMRSTVVPFRNGIMLSAAVGLAESLEVDLVAIANHAGDHAIYPDCRPDFLSAFYEAARLGTYSQVRINAPFVNFTKRDIALIARDINLEPRMTYSCYEGKAIHCGTCGTCVERKEALEGFDTTVYLA